MDIDYKDKNVEWKFMAIPHEVASNQTATQSLRVLPLQSIMTFMPDFGISVYQKYHLLMTVSL